MNPTVTRPSLALRLCLILLACSALLTFGATARAATPPLAIGVNINQAPDQAAQLSSYVSLTGRAPAIVMWYQQWSEPLFWSSQLPHVQAIGAIPMITWDPIYQGNGIPLSQIVAGSYDTYLKAQADAAKAWKGPIFVRLGHEMNLAGSPFGPVRNGNTPAEFVAAWRHVVSIFRQEGATNVEWVFSPNVDCAGKCPFTAFYPGDSWVDWVGLDGYNYSSVDGLPWMTFAQLFGPSYQTLAAMTSKPMMIGETGSTELGGSKATWINQTFASLPQSYPRIRAVVWFDRLKETDWRVNSSSAALAAWNQIVRSAAYAGTASSLLTVTPLAKDVDSQFAAPVSTLPRHTVLQATASMTLRSASSTHRTTKKRARLARRHRRHHARSHHRHRHHRT